MYTRCCPGYARAVPFLERDLNGSITSGVYRSTCGSWTYLWTLDHEGSAEK